LFSQGLRFPPESKMRRLRGIQVRVSTSLCALKKNTTHPGAWLPDLAGPGVAEEGAPVVDAGLRVHQGDGGPRGLLAPQLREVLADLLDRRQRVLRPGRREGDLFSG